MSDFMWPTPDLPQEWKADAACRGMDTNLFFPAKGDHRAMLHVRAICNGCTVREQCLDYAVQLGEKFGVWGGLSERQRRAVRRESNTRRVRVVQCGTRGGYRKHKADGTEPCQPCAEAARVAFRVYKENRHDRGAA